MQPGVNRASRTMTSALGALRLRREAELAEARAAHEAASRVVARLRAAATQTAAQLEADAAPRPGERVDLAVEAHRQAHLGRERARLAAEHAALAQATRRQQDAQDALADALRALRAVDVLDERAARAALATQRRRQAAETEDRNRG
ncbi:MAG: hypothetical protein R3F60_33955 [bacterium]